MPIRAIHVGNPISIENNGGDTWAGAWARDGEVYTPSNDTEGFGNVCHSNIAFNCVTGNDPLTLTGTTVNPLEDYGKGGEEGADGCTWKTSGCIAVDGALYLVVARHKYGEKSGDAAMRQSVRNASIIKSLDGGKTWTRSQQENYNAPMFPGPRFAVPYFIQYGRDGSEAVADQSERYVYAISNNGFWDNGDNMVLGRVERAKIGRLDGANWEYYTGGDGVLDANWSTDMNQAGLILDQPGHLGSTGAAWVKELGRYVMTAWYYPAGGAKMSDAGRETIWEIYESPRPWGPWTKIGAHTFNPQGYYGPSICLKYAANSGRRQFAITAGCWLDATVYRITLVPLDLE